MPLKKETKPKRFLKIFSYNKNIWIEIIISKYFMSQIWQYLTDIWNWIKWT